jgi:cytoskeletal protein CcmA (bactofilin family)
MRWCVHLKETDMFNKTNSDGRSPAEPSVENRPAAKPAVSPGAGAVIGASVNIEGVMQGAEDLLILGSVHGTIQLPNNKVTIGQSGKVSADMVAANIVVEGQADGNLIASGCVTLHKSARVTGRIVAPRVRQEEGGYFKGTIDMDTDSEALKKAFTGSAKPKVVSEHPTATQDVQKDAALAKSAG